MIVVLMGVSGTGKTTVGRLVAARLGVLFLDGDDFHDVASIDAMRAGVALDDEQRQPWLHRLNDELRAHPQGVVLACSALKRSYRDTLRWGLPHVAFVQLAVSDDALAQRLANRPDHYAGRSLLPSQLATLELGDDVVVVDGERAPHDVADDVVRLVTQAGAGERRLGLRALRLEYATNVWNVMEVFVTVTLGLLAGSLALIAFGLDSLIEVFASTVVIWHLRDAAPDLDDTRTHRALRLIAAAFFTLSAYLVVASARSLVIGSRPRGSPVGVAYLFVTAGVMFGLAASKRRVARAMGSEPLAREARMTFLDGCLAVGILSALLVSSVAGWWWADGVAACAVGLYAAWEGVTCWRQGAPHRRAW